MPGVKLHSRKHHVVMENGMVQVTISNPRGIVTGIKYNGIDNLLEVLNDETNRGYWDVVWSPEGSPGTTGTFERIEGTTYEVILETEDQVELSFSRTWDSSLQGILVPLKIDKRFILLRGSSGFYSYAIYEHLEEWPGFNLDETRIAFKLRKDKFHYMAMSSDRQRYMPLPDDRLPGRGQELAYPEAVLLVDPIEPEFKGQMFISAHYAGSDLVVKIGGGVPWKKVYGPVFMYFNSVTYGEDPLTLWDDANQQMLVERQSWPYSFPASKDFQKSEQRGSVTGKLLVRDRYMSDDYMFGNGAYVGLAPQGEVGSWQQECKNYQFWTKANEEGYFSINNINSGEYNLYAWVPGFLGDYKNDTIITITSGCNIDMGDLIYEPPRDGPTLWEIGIPDRSAAEFYVPDPDVKYTNDFLTKEPNRFRQYGLWERYSELYPDEDLVYTIGESDYAKHWFYAHVTRKKDENTYVKTTWRINFSLTDLIANETFKLKIALASAHRSNLQVRVNDPNLAHPPLLSTGIIGGDNAIARHGIHGLYWLYNVDIPSSKLYSQQVNTIYLTQANAGSPFCGVMYDYIRLEGPHTSS